jgi:hypothetical protein
MFSKVRNGRRYLYRSVRHGHRVRTQYIGPGPVADWFAFYDDAMEKMRVLKKAELARFRTEGRQIVALLDRHQALVSAALTAAGWHRNCRGPWRYSRMAKARKRSKATSRGRSRAATLERAADGDERALATVGRWVEAEPVLAMLWGDLAATALKFLLERGLENNPLQQKLTGEYMQQMKRQLLGPKPPGVLMLLLVEHVCLCWLDLHLLELHATPSTTPLELRGAPPTRLPKTVELLDKRREGAHRRYLSALRTLHAVQKAGPAGARAEAGADPKLEPVP